jgi:hypothetical protein
MEINKTIKFHIESLRKIPNPYRRSESDNAEEMYIAVCDVRDLPSDIPMKTNPREQKLTKTVPKKIKESLLTNNEKFYLLNRGLLLSVDSLTFNNYNNELTLSFIDDEVHGDIDGGHTYKIITENSDAIERGRQFVKIEILIGVEGIFQDLAAARNTSTQVEDKSIAELEKKFDIIKAVLYAPQSDLVSKVYFKENEQGDVDVSDLIAILSMFNLKQYPSREDAAVISYSGKKKCVDNYIAEYNQNGNTLENPFVKMSRVMMDILDLYDTIEENIGVYYKQKNSSGKFGLVSGVGVKNDRNTEYFKTRFFQREKQYTVPNGFIYPILGAFRALLKVESDGYYNWKQPPKTILSKIGADLVATTIDRSRSLGNNPQSVGKDGGNWRQLYLMVLLATIDG